MIARFRPGDQKQFTKTVTEADFVRFDDGVVLHPVYSTYALGRDFEWTSRQFFLEVKEAGEEGVGTLLHIEHQSPACAGDRVTLVATVEKIEKNELLCTLEARVGDRLIATGRTGQKMLKKEKLDRLFRKHE
jgi:predicted thioesterase